MMGFFARISGLSRLASRYATEGPPDGERRVKQTVQVGGVRYRSCVTTCVTPRGLYLWVRPPLTRSHPQLLIPWHEIEDTQAARLYSRRALRLSVGRPQLGTVTVYQGLFKSMQPYLHLEEGRVQRKTGAD